LVKQSLRELCINNNINNNTHYILYNTYSLTFTIILWSNLISSHFTKKNLHFACSFL
jgi:hypothetical protein